MWTSPRWIAIAALLLGCAGDDDGFGAGADDDAADDDALGDDEHVPVDPDSWELVGPLDLGAYGALEWVALHDGWLVTQGHRWSLADATHEERPYEGWPDGYFEQSVTCWHGDRAYLLAGGGNGVFSPYADYHYEVYDMVAPAWLEGGDHDFPIHAPGVARDEGRCIVVGGNAGGGMNPTAAVQEFRLEEEMWDYHPPMPREVMYPLAAVLDGVLLVAGGGADLEYQEGQGGTYWGIAVDDVSLLDTADPGAGWTAAPSLPVPLLYSGAVAHDGRYVVFGGVTNGDLLDEGLRSEVWSWAPGEDDWRQDGGLPVEAFEHRVLVDGDEVYLVVIDTGQHELWRWLR